MNDDELIERLRRSLHAEADAIRPGSAPTRVTRLADRRRRPWPVAAAALGVAALVAVAVLVVSQVAGSGHPQQVEVGGGGPPAPRVSQPTHRTLPTTQAPRSPSPATTVPAATRAASTPVGAGFEPGSVSFDTADQGWVLGVAECGSGPCLQLATTSDGGRSWSLAGGAPPITVSYASLDSQQVRFATAEDGWVFGNTDGRPDLWATHDGGTTWTKVALPGLSGVNASLADVEAADGQVHAVGISASASVVIDDSPVATDNWTRSSVAVSLGAGGVADISLTLQGSSGWVLVNDKVVIDGAQLNASGQWIPWNPPCLAAKGPAVLAASTEPDLAATCDWGLWGPAAHTGERLELSSNGGTSFADAGPVPSVLGATASPSPSTVVGIANDQSQLLATFDAGSSWTSVLSEPGSHLVQVGFENGDQGVAIAQSTSATTGQLLMTRDGGHTWTEVDLHS